MKVEQGYGTVQDDMVLSGFLGGKVINQKLTKGERVFALVEHKNGTISSSIKTDNGFGTRINGNVFQNNNKLKLVR